MIHGPKFLNLVNEAREQIVECSAETLKIKLDEKLPFLLIDIREESEWQQERIPGAIHLGKGIIERDIESIIPSTNTELILYCSGGYRSILAAFNLKKMGYKNVKSMSGGFKGWKNKKHPITF